jgi:CII-binding regulator of phage lambda lysogenization HflD
VAGLRKEVGRLHQRLNGAEAERLRLHYEVEKLSARLEAETNPTARLEGETKRLEADEDVYQWQSQPLPSWWAGVYVRVLFSLLASA